jgi:ankyrin repeat protein
MDALSCLQAQPNFHEIVSTTNDGNQTLAHLCIFYNYPSLLGRLVEWGVDLAISDVNGLTALHCAYTNGDSESVRILRRGGASETATDKLGRTPSELRPEGFESDIDVDAEVDPGLDTEAHQEGDDIDVQLALGEQFDKLDLEGDSDSGTGQSDSDDAASDDDGDPSGVVVDSPAGGNEGGGGGGTSGSERGPVVASAAPARGLLTPLADRPLVAGNTSVGLPATLPSRDSPPRSRTLDTPTFFSAASSKSHGPPPEYQDDRPSFDVEDAGLPKYTPLAHHPAFIAQKANLAHDDRHQHEFGDNPYPAQYAPSTRKPSTRTRPLPPTPGGPRPMHQPQPQQPPIPAARASPPPPPMKIPDSPLEFPGSGSSIPSYYFRSPLPRPSLPSDSENMISHAPKTPGHICAGRGLEIVFYRGDATALPMYGRGDRIEGHIDLKNTKDVCQIEITVRLLSNLLASYPALCIAAHLAVWPVPTGIPSTC